jgi:hypothetical protein
MGQNVGQHVENSREQQQPFVFASLRFNGLYHSPNDDGFYVLRFYEDGVVVAASVSSSNTEKADLKKVAKWFNRDHPRSPKGTYKIEGKKLTFSTTIVYGEGEQERKVTVDYSGTIEDEGSTLVLEFYSHATSNRGKRRYEFVEMELSKP